MDLLAHLDLRVQGLVGHGVELRQHIVDSTVACWSTRGSWRRADAWRRYGSFACIVLIHSRPALDLPRASTIAGCVSPN